MPRPLEVVGVTLAERLRGGAGPAAALDDRGAESTLPVLSALAPLFPAGGLRRGSTIAVQGSASLLLALIAGASRSGAWSAAIGLPGLGVVAAAEAGVILERFAFVPRPGPDLAGVVAALADGMDLVAVGAPGRLSAVQVRRLVARARQRGTVLLGFGGWPGADLRLSLRRQSWEGLGAGHGHLRARHATVRMEGRGSAARPRDLDVWLPASTGVVAVVDTAPAPPELAWPRRAEAG